ncbi:sigma-70 family RNA polymerase sigma factor [Janibacter hoylei]|uniref:sigma-70 family RNA polymerase sigma factor n=1 Tax=Janibacter hoylei TaxID=364298 RepID=UPI002237811A|nr:sigma-70 family RNA polymerase sigma factor [Janibacter hoylei]MCW4602930.1 sigma-70 family RNA polymerase sigma factor [Janibacter hoylei]
MTDMVMRPAEQPAGVGALPSHIDIDAEITALEAHLARLLAVREAQTVEDATPWVLDHSDDEWVSSPGVGASAFNRRARQAGLLTTAEEVTLARRIEAGAFARERLASGVELRRTERRGLEHVVRTADEARERMILANTRLVMSIARKCLPRAGRGMQFEDLQQAGLIGLMRAVDKFDHTLGHKFSTYATWWIKQSISRAIDDEARVVRIPVHALESARRIDTLEAKGVPHLARGPGRPQPAGCRRHPRRRRQGARPPAAVPEPRAGRRGVRRRRRRPDPRPDRAEHRPA